MCLSFASFLLLFWSDISLLLVWSSSLLNFDLNVVARAVRGDLSPLNTGCYLLVELDMSVSTVFPILCPCSRSFNALCMFARNGLLEMKNHGLPIELATHSSSCKAIRRVGRARLSWRTYCSYALSYKNGQGTHRELKQLNWIYQRSMDNKKDASPAGHEDGRWKRSS